MPVRPEEIENGLVSHVIGPFNRCLGDCWALINHAARTSMSEGREVRVSTRVMGGAAMAPGVPPRGEDVRPLLEEVTGALDMRGAMVSLVDGPATSMARVTVDTFLLDYLPTRASWSPGPHGRACCQLTNAQLEQHCARAMKRHERLELEAWLEGRLEVVRLGKHMSLSECCEAMASSDLFVGIDSGMSHVAHSVGVPVLIHEWAGLDKHHPGKKFRRFVGVAEAIEAASSLLGGEPA